ncbi:MAG: haloacid dehalogenase-like hydrolase [Actinomycetia bacterium]|nr:haloacid dehalogenase-like hydrolase [Actinomycetes bacterium]
MRRLLLKRVIPPQLALKTSFWGLRYKLRMSVQQELVRSYIFSGLTELSVPEVGQLMADLYEQELKPLLRPRGLLAIQQARQDDRRIALVSASFRPIISILAREVQADFFICTEMEIQGNNYTGRVAVIPPESYHKLLQLRASADDLYGEGNWVLDSAYGDHISDSYILSAALHPFAVHPDHRLQTLAEELGWSVCYW